MESKSALNAMQQLETRSDEELATETRFRADAQAILGTRAAERMDAENEKRSWIQAADRKLTVPGGQRAGHHRCPCEYVHCLDSDT